MSLRFQRDKNPSASGQESTTKGRHGGWSSKRKFHILNQKQESEWEIKPAFEPQSTSLVTYFLQEGYTLPNRATHWKPHIPFGHLSPWEGWGTCSFKPCHFKPVTLLLPHKAKCLCSSICMFLATALQYHKRAYKETP